MAQRSRYRDRIVPMRVIIMCTLLKNAIHSSSSITLPVPVPDSVYCRATEHRILRILRIQRSSVKKERTHLEGTGSITSHSCNSHVVFVDVRIAQARIRIHWHRWRNHMVELASSGTRDSPRNVFAAHAIFKGATTRTCGTLCRCGRGIRCFRAKKCMQQENNRHEDNRHEDSSIKDAS